MQGPKLYWGDFSPYGVFDDTRAAHVAVNRALKKAVPRLRPAGKNAVYWTQGASVEEHAAIRAKLKDERVAIIF